MPELVEFTPEKPSFFNAFVNLFSYPVRGCGLYIIIGICAISVALQLLGLVTRFLPFGNFLTGILSLALLGCILGYLLHVLTKSALGEDAPPDWQAVGDWNDMLRPTFLVLGVTLVSFLPVIVLRFAMGHEYVSCSALVPWGLLLAGCLYFPMALTATAMLDSPAGLNPLFVVQSIFRTGWIYFLAWGILALTVVVSYLLISFLPQILCVTNAVVTAVFMYLLLIVGRVCGLIYRHRREKLDWPCE